MNVYETAPVFFTPRFSMRLVAREDAPGLLKVYSDPVSRFYVNADNCTSDFRYATVKEMEECIDMWIWSYQHGYFVRWTILDERKRPVGTVEMFRQSDKDNGTGVLRIDLASYLEFPDVFDELFRSLLPALHEIFGCERILTKALPIMSRRKIALVLHGFFPAKDPLVGENGVEYPHYWARRHKLT